LGFGLTVSNMTLEVETAGLDVSVLLEVLEAGDSVARIALARQLAAHLADPETPDVERAQVTPVVLKLAADADRMVRLVLNEELVTVEKLPSEILFAVIADEEALALPFLSVTPALTKAQMLAILRVGDIPRQVTVASRADLSVEAARYIIKNAPPRVVAELLRNPVVSLEAEDFRSIYTRLVNVPQLVVVLLEQDGLPADIRITEARRTASRMRQMMAEKGWVPANDANEAIADAEETTILKIIVDAPESEIKSTMTFLSSKNMLTPSLLVRAAAIGEIKVVTAVLSHLASYSIERTRDFMFKRGAAGLKSLFAKTTLPANCIGIVQAACEVAAQAEGEGYALSREVFGKRVLEVLMTRHEHLSPTEHAKQFDYLARYADDRVRKIARRLRTDMARAA
jgi:uncharacterized protein (DUF2336 family)